MGCICNSFAGYIVEKVGQVLNRYETDASFSRIDDKDLIYIPKCYLMWKVRCVDLEYVWSRLPAIYQEDIDLLKARPCVEHCVGGDGDCWEGCIRKRDCYMCMYGEK